MRAWLVSLFVLLALPGLAAVSEGFRSCAGWTVDANTTELPPCPDRPNCVAGRIAPGARSVTLLALRAAIEAEGGSRIEFESDTLVVATFRSRLFGFVDEAVFLRAGDGSISYRCGACSGYYDFGVNRRRMERIAARLAAPGDSPGST